VIEFAHLVSVAKTLDAFVSNVALAVTIALDASGFWFIDTSDVRLAVVCCAVISVLAVHLLLRLADAVVALLVNGAQVMVVTRDTVEGKDHARPGFRIAYGFLALAETGQDGDALVVGLAFYRRYVVLRVRFLYVGLGNVDVTAR